MTSTPDRERLKQLLELADLHERKQSAEFNLKSQEEMRLAAKLALTQSRPSPNREVYDTYAASGAATLWTEWRRQESRKLAILSARARLASEAARKAFAKASARRRVIEKLSVEDPRGD
ncbi:MAG: hypothetical protein AAGF94_09950 [Pseudomonadota bacterium]